MAIPHTLACPVSDLTPKHSNFHLREMVPPWARANPPRQLLPRLVLTGYYINSHAVQDHQIAQGENAI